MRVLIAIDDSLFSEAAVDSVIKGRWPEQCEFKIISVVEPIISDWSKDKNYNPSCVLATEQHVCDARQQMVDDYAEKMKKEMKIENVTTEVLLNYPVETILETVTKWNADLLVVGSHGRKGISRFFLGSVAEQLARRCPCSIEIVKIESVELGGAEKFTASEGVQR
ncbi:MAG: universal stress protein [Cyanobacteria bacterium SZAS TMP-1]|nr:universal stress protein [Cyanobacteria bacterium SZAS TMP-1]